MTTERRNHDSMNAYGRFKFTACAVLGTVLAAAAAMAQSTPASPAPPAPVDTAEYGAVPMQTCAAGSYCVPITIEGRELRFLVDTGASFSLIDPSIVKALDLPLDPRRKIRMAEMTGRQRNHRVTEPVFLHVGAYLIPPVNLVVVDLEPIRGSFEELLSIDIHGIIGNSVLKRHAAVIDYGRETLFLRNVTPSATGTSPPP